MGYLGNAPALAYTSFAKQDFTVTATTSYSLDHPVANANEIALFINFVRQEPTTSYSASGTTLTLTEATSSSDDMYCVYLGKAVQTVNPPNASVGTAQLVDDAVTKDKVSNLMYPAFMATMGTSNQTVSDDATTKVQLTNKVIDTDNAFDNSTNYRFTVPSGGAGKYLINGAVTLRSSSTSTLQVVYAWLYKNGSAVNLSMAIFNNNPLQITTQDFSVLIDLVVGDYIELFGYIDVSSGTPAFDPGVTGDTIKSTYLAGFRIGD